MIGPSLQSADPLTLSLNHANFARRTVQVRTMHCTMRFPLSVTLLSRCRLVVPSLIPCRCLFSDLQYSNISHNSLLQCSHCGTAASDVYQTYPVSLLLVDMLLFKRGVYRHLLWNRGPAPLRDRRRHRTKIMLVLGVTGIAVDACKFCSPVGSQARSQTWVASHSLHRRR